MSPGRAAFLAPRPVENHRFKPEATGALEVPAIQRKSLTQPPPHNHPKPSKVRRLLGGRAGGCHQKRVWPSLRGSTGSFVQSLITIVILIATIYCLLSVRETGAVLLAGLSHLTLPTLLGAGHSCLPFLQMRKFSHREPNLPRQCQRAHRKCETEGDSVQY